MKLRVVFHSAMAFSALAISAGQPVLAAETAMPGMSRQVLLKQPLPPLGANP